MFRLLSRHQSISTSKFFLWLSRLQIFCENASYKKIIIKNRTQKWLQKVNSS
jgi:hypothetical protein